MAEPFSVMHLCNIKDQLPSLLISAFILISVFIAFFWLTIGSKKGLARHILNWSMFFSLMMYALVIPDSYIISKKVGTGMGFSGWLIGTYFLGSNFGALFCWHAMKKSPDMWWKAPQTILLPTAISQIVGAMLYTVATFMAAYIPYHSTWNLVTRFELLLSRFVLGCAQGMVEQMTLRATPYLVSMEDRPHATSVFILCVNLGIGLGPMADSFMSVIDRCPQGADPVQGVGILHALLGIFIFVLLQMYPKLKSAPEDSEECVSAQKHPLGEKHSEEELARKTKVIVGSLIMTTVRAFIVAALEAAVALLLQTKYGVRQQDVGLLIAIAFLASIPVHYCRASLSWLMSDIAWMRLANFVALLGAVLCFPQTCTTGNCMWQLIIGSMLLFPCLYVSDSLNWGTATKHFFPPGTSLLDATHASLWYIICSNGIGRSFGPWVARMMIALGGQVLYSWLQFLVLVTFMVLFEAKIRPNILL